MKVKLFRKEWESNAISIGSLYKNYFCTLEKCKYHNKESDDFELLDAIFQNNQTTSTNLFKIHKT